MLAAAASIGGARDDAPWELAPPAPAVALKPARLDGAESHACAECHGEVVTEWADTAHAIAWVDEPYQHELADRPRPELCHGCHIPEPLLAGGGEPTRPKARERDHALGISCDACHLGPGGAMLGASGATTDAHATARSASLAIEGSSALCAACHSTNIGPVVGIAKDFVASKQSERGRSCVGCHMAAVERAASEGRAARAGRSHALQTPRDPTFLRRAFALSLVASGGKSAVKIENRAGHRVPGLIGREIRFGVFAPGADASAKPQAEHALDARKYLPVDGSIEIPLAAAAERVLVRGWHVDPRAEAPVLFLEAEIERAR